MCDTCVRFASQRCPPVLAEPDPDHAEDLAFEQALQTLLAATDRRPTHVEPVTVEMLRARLERPAMH